MRHDGFTCGFAIFMITLAFAAGPARATVVYYSADTGTNQVIRTDGVTRQVVASGLSGPRAFALGPDGLLYVGEEGGLHIGRYDPATGRRVGAVFAAGPKRIGIAFGSDGLLYTTSGGLDYRSDRVERYDSGSGAAAGSAFATPSARAQYSSLSVSGGYYETLTFGPDGNLYCGGNHTGTIDVFQGPRGATPGALTSRIPTTTAPAALAFGPDAAMYVADYAGGRILRYDGAAFRPFATGTYLLRPAGLDFGPDGDLYVANQGKGNILRIQGPSGAQPGALVGVFATTPIPITNLMVVPEPSGAVALLVAAAGGWMRRRRRRV
jgi:DNA-binding beta-propeller fold protein YncE